MISHFCLFFAILQIAFGAHLATIDGQLVRVVDNCTPGDDNTCPSGKCCVKEGLMYIPEYTGPRPVYEIACKPYRQKGEFCYNMNTVEMCPCEAPLTCTSSGSFGHCH